MSSRVLSIVSGGLDSVTMAYMLHGSGYRLGLLSFDYSQKHRRELEFAARAAERLGVPHRVVDLRALGGLLRGSALTDPDVNVPDGEYARENIAQTVVPNRNAIMLSVAFGVAMAEGYQYVAYAAHAGDHEVYPDCTPSFVQAFQEMEKEASGNYWGIQLLAPFVNLPKAEIVRLGHEFGVPFEDTWSCYKGGDVHCGTCSTCLERKAAFKAAGIEDPTVYAVE